MNTIRVKVSASSAVGSGNPSPIWGIGLVILGRSLALGSRRYLCDYLYLWDVFEKLKTKRASTSVAWRVYLTIIQR